MKSRLCVIGAVLWATLLACSYTAIHVVNTTSDGWWAHAYVLAAVTAYTFLFSLGLGEVVRAAQRRRGGE